MIIFDDGVDSANSCSVITTLLQLPADDSSVLLSHGHSAASSSGMKDDDGWSASLASQKVDRIETAQQVCTSFTVMCFITAAVLWPLYK